MQIVLTPDMANELLKNEDDIKNEKGAYRPQFNPVSKSFVPVIACWPLEDFKGKFDQVRLVKKGYEDQVDDIAIMKIDNGKVEYKVNKCRWEPTRDPRKGDKDISLQDYSIYIYEPTFNNDAYFITCESFSDLVDELKKYHIDVKTSESVNVGIVIKSIQEAFKRYEGICTYILFCGEYVIDCGTWRKRDVY